jgi:hypothetical protein
MFERDLIRLTALLVTGFLTGSAIAAQEAASQPQAAEEAPADQANDASAGQATEPSADEDTPQLDLPVSLDRIRKELERPSRLTVPDVRDQPTFRVEVQERNRLQDLLLTLDFSAGPTPAGGLYAAEMQRMMFPSVSNPLRQPLAAFNQTELLTVLIQTLAGTYLAGRAIDAISNADRAAAEAAARAELRRAIALYCGQQPDSGAGIAICTTARNGPLPGE